MNQQLDLATLLAAGERSVFHGAPSAAVATLESAIAGAREQSRRAETAAATWLLGVAWGALGKYGHALDVLDVLIASDHGAAAEERLFASLACSVEASVHRQLGRHGAARELDLTALEQAGNSREAGFDALLGLAADAVGLGDAPEAAGYLEQAVALVPIAGDDAPAMAQAALAAPAAAVQWWRQLVRLDWVRAESALLGDDPSGAAQHAAAAVARAEGARAPRHVAKGLLFRGVAEAQISSSEAVQTLLRAAALADALDALPLVWPARAMLASLLAEVDPAQSEHCRSAARTAALAIAADLPPALREEWTARADIAPLLQD